jgi:dephospho-CoA kinase
MLKIGLTGGIGCGKSKVSALFEHFSIPVIDADIIARQLLAIGQPALKLIVKSLGVEIINPDNELNRRKLKQIIFSDPEKKND